MNNNSNSSNDNASDEKENGNNNNDRHIMNTYEVCILLAQILIYCSLAASILYLNERIYNIQCMRLLETIIVLLLGSFHHHCVYLYTDYLIMQT